MRIAVLGSGGREHAIAWKLAQDDTVSAIYSIPGNGGTSNNIAIDVNDFKTVRDFCAQNSIDLVIVGPEVPLVAGIVDYFSDSRIRVFGPDRRAAQLEGSKIWAKEFMRRYGVQTADYQIVESSTDAATMINMMSGDLVIKYDGLAAGKGVFVCSDIPEAQHCIDLLLQSYGTKARYLIEEKLSGREISVIGFTDGHSIQLLRPSQDHKPIYDGDKGPNTGGMGAYCPVPFCDNALMNKIRTKIIEPTLAGMQAEKLNYIGVIYFGLMITDNEPYLLEYNVRLGDPETEVILPALDSDLVDIIHSCYDHSLDSLKLSFKSGFWVDVVMASGGYPEVYEKGFKICGLNDVGSDYLVFHAGTRRDGTDVLTSGGRVLNVVSTAHDLRSAIDKAYQEVEKIKFKNSYYRKDIGVKGLMS